MSLLRTAQSSPRAHNGKISSMREKFESRSKESVKLSSASSFFGGRGSTSLGDHSTTADSTTTIDTELKQMLHNATRESLKGHGSTTTSSGEESIQSYMRTLSGSNDSSSFSISRAFNAAKRKMNGKQKKSDNNNDMPPPLSEVQTMDTNAKGNRKVDLGGNLQMNFNHTMPIDRVHIQNGQQPVPDPRKIIAQKSKKEAYARAEKLLQKLDEQQQIKASQAVAKKQKKTATMADKLAKRSLGNKTKMQLQAQTLQSISTNHYSTKLDIQPSSSSESNSFKENNATSPFAAAVPPPPPPPPKTAPPKRVSQKQKLLNRLNKLGVKTKDVNRNLPTWTDTPNDVATEEPGVLSKFDAAKADPDGSVVTSPKADPDGSRLASPWGSMDSESLDMSTIVSSAADASQDASRFSRRTAKPAPSHLSRSNRRSTNPFDKSSVQSKKSLLSSSQQRSKTNPFDSDSMSSRGRSASQPRSTNPFDSDSSTSHSHSASRPRSMNPSDSDTSRSASRTTKSTNPYESDASYSRRSASQPRSTNPFDDQSKNSRSRQQQQAMHSRLAHLRGIPPTSKQSEPRSERIKASHFEDNYNGTIDSTPNPFGDIGAADIALQILGGGGAGGHMDADDSSEEFDPKFLEENRRHDAPSFDEGSTRSEEFSAGGEDFDAVHVDEKNPITEDDEFDVTFVKSAVQSSLMDDLEPQSVAYEKYDVEDEEESCAVEEEEQEDAFDEHSDKQTDFPPIESDDSSEPTQDRYSVGPAESLEDVINMAANMLSGEDDPTESGSFVDMKTSMEDIFNMATTRLGRGSSVRSSNYGMDDMMDFAAGRLSAPSQASVPSSYQISAAPPSQSSRRSPYTLSNIPKPELTTISQPAPPPPPPKKSASKLHPMNPATPHSALDNTFDFKDSASEHSNWNPESEVVFVDMASTAPSEEGHLPRPSPSRKTRLSQERPPLVANHKTPTAPPSRQPKQTIAKPPPAEAFNHEMKALADDLSRSWAGNSSAQTEMEDEKMLDEDDEYWDTLSSMRTESVTRSHKNYEPLPPPMDPRIHSLAPVAESVNEDMDGCMCPWNERVRLPEDQRRPDGANGNVALADQDDELTTASDESFDENIPVEITYDQQVEVLKNLPPKKHLEVPSDSEDASGALDNLQSILTESSSSSEESSLMYSDKQAGDIDAQLKENYSGSNVEEGGELQEAIKRGQDQALVDSPALSVPNSNHFEDDKDRDPLGAPSLPTLAEPKAKNPENRYGSARSPNSFDNNDGSLIVTSLFSRLETTKEEIEEKAATNRGKESFDFMISGLAHQFSSQEDLDIGPLAPVFSSIDESEKKPVITDGNNTTSLNAINELLSDDQSEEAKDEADDLLLSFTRSDEPDDLFMSSASVCESATSSDASRGDAVGGSAKRRKMKSDAESKTLQAAMEEAKKILARVQPIEASTRYEAMQEAEIMLARAPPVEMEVSQFDSSQVKSLSASVAPSFTSVSLGEASSVESEQQVGALFLTSKSSASTEDPASIDQKEQIDSMLANTAISDSAGDVPTTDDTDSSEEVKPPAEQDSFPRTASRGTVEPADTSVFSFPYSVSFELGAHRSSEDTTEKLDDSISARAEDNGLSPQKLPSRALSPPSRTETPGIRDILYVADRRVSKIVDPSAGLVDYTSTPKARSTSPEKNRRRFSLEATDSSIVRRAPSPEKTSRFSSEKRRDPSPEQGLRRASPERTSRGSNDFVSLSPEKRKEDPQEQPRNLSPHKIGDRLFYTASLLQSTEEQSRRLSRLTIETGNLVPRSPMPSRVAFPLPHDDSSISSRVSDRSPRLQSVMDRISIRRKERETEKEEKARAKVKIIAEASSVPAATETLEQYDLLLDQIMRQNKALKRGYSASETSLGANSIAIRERINDLKKQKKIFVRSQRVNRPPEAVSAQNLKNASQLLTTAEVRDDIRPPPPQRAPPSPENRNRARQPKSAFRSVSPGPLTPTSSNHRSRTPTGSPRRRPRPEGFGSAPEQPRSRSVPHHRSIASKWKDQPREGPEVFHSQRQKDVVYSKSQDIFRTPTESRRGNDVVHKNEYDDMIAFFSSPTWEEKKKSKASGSQNKQHKSSQQPPPSATPYLDRLLAERGSRPFEATPSPGVDARDPSPSVRRYPSSALSSSRNKSTPSRQLSDHREMVDRMLEQHQEEYRTTPRYDRDQATSPTHPIDSPEKRRLLGKSTSEQTKQLHRDVDLARLTSSKIRTHNETLSFEMESFKQKLSQHSQSKRGERAIMTACQSELDSFQQRIQIAKRQMSADSYSDMTLESAWEDFSEVRGAMLTNLKLMHDAQESLIRERFRMEQDHDDDSKRLGEIEQLMIRIRRQEKYDSALVQRALDEAERLGSGIDSSLLEDRQSPHYGNVPDEAHVLH